MPIRVNQLLTLATFYPRDLVHDVHYPYYQNSLNKDVNLGAQKMGVRILYKNVHILKLNFESKRIMYELMRLWWI